MKFKAMGLVLVLGLSLSGCVASTSREDLRTCQDANYFYGKLTQIQGLDYRYSNTSDVSASFWGVRQLAKDLRDLSVRDISSELSDALLSDADRFVRDSSDVPLMTDLEEFCVSNFGEKYYWG